MKATMAASMTAAPRWLRVHLQWNAEMLIGSEAEALNARDGGGTLRRACSRTTAPLSGSPYKLFPGAFTIDHSDELTLHSSLAAQRAWRALNLIYYTGWVY